MITVSELSKIVSADGRQKSIYVSRIRKFWCNRMKANGRCEMPCSKSMCAAHIKNIVSGINTNEARSPEAVLIWRIRNEAASVEERSEAPRIAIDKLLGIPAKQDAFAMILSEIGGD